MNKVFDNRVEVAGFFAAAAILLLLLPGLNAWTEPGSAFHFSSFQLSLWGKYVTYAVLAMSLNLLWGYTGLLCLCQSLFFALGGYAFGMYLMLMIGERGAYQSALPDSRALGSISQFSLRFRRGPLGSGAGRPDFRIPGISLPNQRRLFFHPHSSPDLRRLFNVLPKRLHLRRE